MDQVSHLLDTHAVIWAYQDSSNLGPTARLTIQKAAARTLGISDFTLLEIAMLARKGRIQFHIPLLEFLQQAEKDYVVLPLGPAEAVAAVDVTLKQGDPFDRAIVATALSHKLPLLTKDQQITEAGVVKVVW